MTISNKLLVSALALATTFSFSHAQEYAQIADQELNETYQYIINALPKPQQDSLKAAQRLWIQYTDANCKAKESIAAIPFEQCRAQAAVNRTQELEQDLRSKIPPQISPVFTDELKKNINNLATIFGQAKNSGPKTVTDKLTKKLSYYYVSRAFGQPIFINGPHSDTVLDLNAIEEFGYYNPEFLTWLQSHFKAILADKDFVAQTKPLVDEYLLNSAELFLVTDYYLKDNPAIRDALLQEYKNQYRNYNLEANHHYHLYIEQIMKKNPNWDGTDKTKQYIWEYPPVTTQMEQLLIELDQQKWYYTQYGTAIFFWMRRAIDGTDQQFLTLLTDFMQAYDPEKLLEIKSKNYKLSSDLPLGTVSF